MVCIQLFLVYCIAWRNKDLVQVVFLQGLQQLFLVVAVLWENQQQFLLVLDFDNSYSKKECQLE